MNIDLKDVKISQVTQKDFPEIRKLYSYYVKNTHATFEEKTPHIKTMISNWQKNNLPFIIAKYQNKIVGYAYLAPYRTRSCYRYTVTDSIYIHKDFQGKKIGSLLLPQIISEAKKHNLKQIIAIIGLKENENTNSSLILHQKSGFKQQCTLKDIGEKFNQPISTAILQLAIY